MNSTRFSIVIPVILFMIFFLCCENQEKAVMVNENKQTIDLDNGLVAHWSFDVLKDSIAIDSSANQINGRLYNITKKDGVKGNSIGLNGKNSVVFYPDSAKTPPVAISSLAEGSISVWFRFKNYTGNVLPVLYFGEADTGTPHSSLIIEIGHGQNPENTKLYFTIVNARFCFDSGFNLKENKWYHFVAVVSKNGNTGFLNGKEIFNRHYNLGSNSRYSDFFTSVPVKEIFCIGYGRYGQQDPFYYFNGLIDEVYIYNRALNKAEINQLFKYGNPG